MMRPLIAILAAAVLAAACTGGSRGDSAQPGSAVPAPTFASPSGDPGTGAAPEFTGELSPAAVLAAHADYSALRDDEWSADAARDIALTGSGARSDADGVRIDGATVTIAAAGVYRLRGALDGQVVIDAGEAAAVALILDGASIASAAGPAIEGRSADDVAIWMAPGSVNSVSDAASYAADAGANAAIYVDADLAISGPGSLSVTGNGNDGIASTDDLAVLAGVITVRAADDALRGKDALVVSGGTLDLQARAGDGLRSDQADDPARGYILVSGGDIAIEAGDDGAQAQTDVVITAGSISAAVSDDGVKGEGIVSIAGGTLGVTRSAEAIEAASIGIFAGVVDLTSSDDGINGAGADAQAPPGGGIADTGERIEISGGTLTVDSGGDGIDSNGSLSISGGTIVVYGPPTRGNGGIDANGPIAITGGTLLALSGGGMEPAIGAGGQGWVIIPAALSAGQAAALVDGEGTQLVSFASRKAATAVTYSSASVTPGARYSIVSAGSASGSGAGSSGSSGGDELGSGTAGEGGDAGFGGGPRRGPR